MSPQKRPLFYFFISLTRNKILGALLPATLCLLTVTSLGWLATSLDRLSRLSILHNPYLLLSARRKHNNCRRRARSATNQLHAVACPSAIDHWDRRQTDARRTDNRPLHSAPHDPHTMQASSIISFLTLGNVAKIKFSHPKTFFLSTEDYMRHSNSTFLKERLSLNIGLLGNKSPETNLALNNHQVNLLKHL